MKSPTQAAVAPSHMDRTWHIIGIVVINIALPIALYNYMSKHTTEILAVTISGIPPMCKTLYEIVAHDRKDLISFMQIFSMIFSVLLLAVTTNPRVIMAKDSCTTIFFGIMYFVSLTWEEDLFFRFRRQITDKTKEQMDVKWANPKVREISHFLCKVMGTFMITDSCARIVMIYALSVQTVVIISPFIGITCMLTMGYWTYQYLAKHEPDDDFDNEKMALVKVTPENYSTQVASAC
ncbi:hypothetical protein ACHHYP_04530 [Achlya hypogyna]|uniref:Uncharacterized protein n=1 Tax=Achlya hypogyna TaxID=1202772 RepID=A0A1V9Z0Y0_ACHHY|nr:hypothetical protein ACHHYP_04530 [Achlya hypogyna]